MSDKMTRIGELRPFMKNINVVMIVLEKGNIVKTKKKEDTGGGGGASGGAGGDKEELQQHRICHTLVADETASVLVALWDHYIDHIFPGDIIRVTSGYCSIFQKSLMISIGKHGKVEKIGEFTMLFSETPNISSIQWVPDPNNRKGVIPQPPSSV